jgi:serine/threonine protein phosphatase 1
VSAFHRHVPPNSHGRDFVVSDLHGHLGALRRALAERAFSPGRDRLFSVGDLVDRGPDSPGCVALLASHWFHAVRGNHEDMLLRTLAGDEPRIAEIWRVNGGAWGMTGHAASDAARAAAPRLAALPWALTLHHRSGLRFGICHAECPVTDWSRIEASEHDESHRRAMLWGRERIHREGVPPVAGVDLTIHGHTVVHSPWLTGNALFIETGMYLPNGRLTLLCLDGIEREGASFRLPATA